MPAAARYYINAVIVAAAFALAAGLARWSSPHPLEWVLFVGLAALASVPKLRLPGMTATLSPNFLFLLIGILRFTLPEAMVMACAAGMAQTLCNTRKRPTALQVVFNAANLTLTVTACFLVARGWLAAGLNQYRPAVLALLACQYFVINTVLVSGVLALLEGLPLPVVCRQWYTWSFPYYLLGATLVGLIPASRHAIHGEAWLILLPLVYLVHFFVGLADRRPSPPTAEAANPNALPRPARLLILGVLTSGALLLAAAAFQWHSPDPTRFAAYLALGLATSAMKVRFPRMIGSISLGFVTLLVIIAEFSLPEAVFTSALMVPVQSLWKPLHRPRLVQVLFNSASLALATAAAWLFSHYALQPWLGDSLVGALIPATLVLYGVNTLLVASVLCLVQDKPLSAVWQRCYFWTFPYYLVGATAAGLMTWVCHAAGWVPSLLVLPLMALVFVSYRVHVRDAAAREAVSAA